MFLLICWLNSHEANYINTNNFYAYTSKLYLKRVMENFYL
jgi:hypothetical protein